MKVSGEGQPTFASEEELPPRRDIAEEIEGVPDLRDNEPVSTAVRGMGKKVVETVSGFSAFGGPISQRSIHRLKGFPHN